MAPRDPTRERLYASALAVAIVLIVAVLIVSLVWPHMLLWTHEASVRLPPVGRQGSDRRAAEAVPESGRRLDASRLAD
jgi:hypothetical protein